MDFPGFRSKFFRFERFEKSKIFGKMMNSCDDGYSFFLSGVVCVVCVDNTSFKGINQPCLWVTLCVTTILFLFCLGTITFTCHFACSFCATSFGASASSVTFFGEQYIICQQQQSRHGLRSSSTAFYSVAYNSPLS